MKTCCKCLVLKPLEAFAKRKERKSGHGRHSVCKDCSSQYAQNRYQRLRSSELERCFNLNQKYKQNWTKFFQSEYGNSPQCELCQKSLKYYGRRGDKNIVYWDHRHGGDEPITMSPKAWLTNRACSEENQSVWKQCNFGMLCSLCNIRIPTKDRFVWLQKLQDYILKDCHGVGI